MVCLSHFFRRDFLISRRTSATNCARIYNEGISACETLNDLPLEQKTRLAIDVDDVWNAFFLHSLLLDFAERCQADESHVLELPHDAPSQAERLRPALRERNKRMEGPGQEHWNHACDLCCWVFTDSDGSLRESSLRSVVLDTHYIL